MAEELARFSDVIRGLMGHNARLMRMERALADEQREIARLMRLVTQLDGRRRHSCERAPVGAGARGSGDGE